MHRWVYFRPDMCLSGGKEWWENPLQVESQSQSFETKKLNITYRGNKYPVQVRDVSIPYNNR